MSENAPHTGMIVGEYILDSRLGYGATGEVWSAHHHVWTRREVAIKLATNPEFQRSIKQEGILHEDLSQLASPNIVRVFGLSVLHSPPYLIMELVKGEDLRATLKRVGRLPAERARSIMLDIMRGLAAAHGAGVVHRDLKPENVLLDQRGQAKLTDFSIAVKTPDEHSLQLSLAKSPDSAPSLAGTLVYMSPEQRTGRNVTPRSDIYSAGLLLFEMVTGEIPQPGDRIAEIVPDAPDWCDQIFARCYTRMERRYASADELARALESAGGAATHVPARSDTAATPHSAAGAPAASAQSAAPRRKTARLSSRDFPESAGAASADGPEERIPNRPSEKALSTRSFEQLVQSKSPRQQAAEAAPPLTNPQAAANPAAQESAPASRIRQPDAKSHPGAIQPKQRDPAAPRPAAMSDLEALLDDMPDMPLPASADEASDLSAADAQDELRDPRPSRAYDEVLPTLEALYRKEHVGPAMAAYSAGQYASAENAFRRVIEHDPGNNAARQGLAMTLHRRGNHKAALRIFRELLEQAPDVAETWNNVGVVSMAAKRPREAERALLRALELRPRYASAHANLSAVYQQMGRLDEARTHAQQALEIDPNNDAASFNAGLAGQ